jgi:hypothetical protein
MGRQQMLPDDSLETSKDDRCLLNELSAEERWVDRMKPFRQRGYTQSERDRLARAIRQCRRERFEEMRAASSSRQAEIEPAMISSSISD